MSTDSPFTATRAHWAGLAATILLATALFVGGIWAGWPSDETIALIGAQQHPENAVQVVVPRVEIAAGQPIHERDLELLWLPPDYVPSAVLLSMRDAIGRRPTSRLLPGEPIREERFLETAQPPELTAPEPPEGAP